MNVLGKITQRFGRLVNGNAVHRANEVESWPMCEAVNML